MSKPDVWEKNSIRKLTCLDIEIALAEYFGIRRNIIVPNVWWGAGFNHELDMLIISKSGCGYEIEIKTSRSDIIADLKKPHHHFSTKIREVWFAIPECLIYDAEELVPIDFGIIAVCQNLHNNLDTYCKIIRTARRNLKYYKFTEKERLKVAELGTMRIWSLKKELNRRNLERLMKA